MIPVVTVVAITLMGIEGIADAIEMPFGKPISTFNLFIQYHQQPRLGVGPCYLPLGEFHLPLLSPRSYSNAFHQINIVQNSKTKSSKFLR